MRRYTGIVHVEYRGEEEGRCIMQRPSRKETLKCLHKSQPWRHNSPIECVPDHAWSAYRRRSSTVMCRTGASVLIVRAIGTTADRCERLRDWSRRRAFQPAPKHLLAVQGSSATTHVQPLKTGTSTRLRLTTAKHFTVMTACFLFIAQPRRVMMLHRSPPLNDYSTILFSHCSAN